MWHNIGKCYHDIQDEKSAEEFFRKALKIKPNFENSLEGMSMVCLNKGEWGLSIDYANRALAENPELLDARVNRGMAYLALGRWKEGWRDYNANIGKEKNRAEIVYGQEPRWNGEKGLDVVAYGEQGLGDEIITASCLPDLIRDSKRVTIECDGRLERLFQRSFPTCEVHGTRYKKYAPVWRTKRPYEARVSFGKLCEIYRSEGEFPGTPFLVPNPEMSLQWRELLKSLGNRPKIGISWKGGLPHTGRAHRSVTLDTFAPLFNFDATWVSLQYTNQHYEVDECKRDIFNAEQKYGVKIHDWDWGNRVFDYDQTASLVSELDLVITITTSIVDLCVGLGKDCWVLVPRVPMWRFRDQGEDFAWGKTIKLFRQKGSEWPIHLLHGALKDRFGDRPRD